MERERAEKTAAAQMQAGCDGMAAREKTWDELGLEGKVERMRNVLRAHEHRLQDTGQLVIEAHELAHDHSHDPLGRVVKLAKDAANKIRGIAGGRRFSPLD